MENTWNAPRHAVRHCSVRSDKPPALGRRSSVYIDRYRIPTSQFLAGCRPVLAHASIFALAIPILTLLSSNFALVLSLGAAYNVFYHRNLYTQTRGTILKLT